MNKLEESNQDYSKHDIKEEEESDGDVWDDSLLIKAYDDAIRGVVHKSVKQNGPKKKSARHTLEENETVSAERGQSIGQVSSMTSNGNFTNMPEPNEEINADLRAVLQAYFDAGCALGRYLESQKYRKSDIQE